MARGSTKNAANCASLCKMQITRTSTCRTHIAGPEPWRFGSRTSEGRYRLALKPVRVRRDSLASATRVGRQFCQSCVRSPASVGEFGAAWLAWEFFVRKYGVSLNTPSSCRPLLRFGGVAARGVRTLCRCSRVCVRVEHARCALSVCRRLVACRVCFSSLTLRVRERFFRTPLRLNLARASERASETQQAPPDDSDLGRVRTSEPAPRVRLRAQGPPVSACVRCVSQSSVSMRPSPRNTSPSASVEVEPLRLRKLYAVPVL